MGLPIAIMLVGGAGLAFFLADKAGAKSGSPGSVREAAENPFSFVPASHKGMQFNRRDVTAKSGRPYRTDSTGPDKNDDVFVIAQLAKTVTDADGNVQGRPWVSYLANRGSGQRRLHRAFAPGNIKASRDALVTQMMKDFGVS